MNYQEQDSFGIYRNHTGPGPRLMGANTLDGNDVYNLRFSSDFQKSSGIVFRRFK